MQAQILREQIINHLQRLQLFLQERREFIKLRWHIKIMGSENLTSESTALSFFLSFMFLPSVTLTVSIVILSWFSTTGGHIVL